MSKEIIFRGKHVHVLQGDEHLDGRWIEGYLADQDYINSPELGGEFLIDPQTICQYTGLTDKNGRKIFEGDIVKEDYASFVAIVRFGEFKTLVFKNQGFNLEWKGIGYRQDLLYWKDRIEVISNIFDNPGLIEKQRLINKLKFKGEG